MGSASARKLANVFTFVSKSSVGPSLTLSQTKAITRHGRDGEVEKAMQVFERMPLRNQVSWNAMLSVLMDSGRLDCALNLFDEMPLKNPTTYTAMIAGLSRAGMVLKARQLFDSVPLSEHNVFSWTAMMACYAQNNEHRRAVELFTGLYGDFFEVKTIPNSHSFSILLKSCGCIKSLAAAKQIQSLIVKLLDEEAEYSVFVKNSLIYVNAKLGKLVDAEGVFSRMKWKDSGSLNAMMDGYTHHLLIGKALEIFYSMKEKDILSWNIAMSGLSECDRGEKALKVFLALSRSRRGLKPNSSTFTIVLTICADLTMLKFGRQMHACIVKTGFYLTNTIVSNSLVTMYASCGSNEDLEQVFDEMPKKDVISWNAVIQGLGQNGRCRKALEIAAKALESKNFNHNTFTAILTSCSHGGLVVEGWGYFNSMSTKYGIEPSLDHYICMVDMLGRAGRLKEAHRFLCSMPFKADSVAWTTLLNACLIHSDIKIGRVAAEELQSLEPCNIRSYLGLAKIYSRNSDIEETRRHLDLIRDKKLRKKPGRSWVVET